MLTYCMRGLEFYANKEKGWDGAEDDTFYVGCHCGQWHSRGAVLKLHLGVAM